SDVSNVADECDVGEEDNGKSMMDERESSSSNPTPPKLSYADDDISDDPMNTKVHELMLVPSLSDFSLSDDQSLKSEKIIKSSPSSALLIRVESDSSEAESESDSIHSRSSASKFDTERVSSSSETVPEIPTYAEIKEIVFEEIPQQKKSIEFDDFFAGNAIRVSSVIEDSHHTLDTRTIVSDFINMLIKKATGGGDPNALKRIQLDKNKLHTGIRDSLAEYMEESILNQILNQMVVDHYNLIKNTRVFAKLSSEDTVSYYNRYRTGLALVAHGEERIAMAKAKASKLIVKAQLELNSGVHSALGTEYRFEQAVRRTLIRPDAETDQLKRLVDRELRLMHHHRVEISYRRYVLITQQHDLAKLQEEIQKLDSVADHVSMQDFLSLQAKVQHFQQKIEERNVELKKMRVQYHKEQYQVHQNREKSLALKDRLLFCNRQLALQFQAKNCLKTQLFEEKMKHIKIRAKSNELAYQGGILSMPSLMYDYDRTMEYIRHKREIINGLKETLRSLHQRLASL
ncbi:hypothetical protein KR038_006366, partial [Drosophila bunnanda]